MDLLLQSISGLGALGLALLFAGSTLFNALPLWLVMNKLMPKELSGASLGRCFACSAGLAGVFILSILMLLIPFPFFSVIFLGALLVWFKGSMAMLEAVFEIPGGDFSALFLYTTSSIGIWFLLGVALPGGAAGTMKKIKAIDPVGSAMNRLAGGADKQAEKDAEKIKGLMNWGSSAPARTMGPTPIPNAPVRAEPRRAWLRADRFDQRPGVKELTNEEMEVRQVFRSAKLEAEDLPKLVDFPDSYMVIGLLIAREEDLDISWRDPVLIHREPSLPGFAPAKAEQKTEAEIDAEWSEQLAAGYYPYLSDWPKAGDRYRAWHAFRLVPAVSDGSPYNDGVLRFRGDDGKEMLLSDPKYQGHPDVYTQYGWKVNNYLFFAVPRDVGMEGWLFSPGPPYEGATVKTLGSIEKAVRP